MRVRRLSLSFTSSSRRLEFDKDSVSVSRAVMCSSRPERPEMRAEVRCYGADIDMEAEIRSIRCSGFLGLVPEPTVPLTLTALYQIHGKQLFIFIWKIISHTNRSIYIYICNSTKKNAKMGSKKLKKKILGHTYHTTFFGSLGVLEYEESDEHALSLPYQHCQTFFRPN